MNTTSTLAKIASIVLIIAGILSIPASAYSAYWYYNEGAFALIAVPTSIIIGMLGLVLIAIGIVTLVLANMSAATNTNQSDSRESQHNGNLSSVIESLNADNIQSYPTATLTEILSSPAGIDYALRRKIEKELNLREQ